MASRFGFFIGVGWFGAGFGIVGSGHIFRLLKEFCPQYSINRVSAGNFCGHSDFICGQCCNINCGQLCDGCPHRCISCPLQVCRTARIRSVVAHRCVVAKCSRCCPDCSVCCPQQVCRLPGIRLVVARNRCVVARIRYANCPHPARCCPHPASGCPHPARRGKIAHRLHF